MGWSARFYDPIYLPSGRKLLTLRDAATYITELPKAEHDAPEWQAAMETLLLVAGARRSGYDGADWDVAGAEPARHEGEHPRRDGNGRRLTGLFNDRIWRGGALPLWRNLGPRSTQGNYNAR